MTSKVVIHTTGEGKVLPMGIRFLSTGENSAHTSMFELTLSAGSSTGLHVHRVHEETFYVLEGECEWQIGEKQVHAKPGAFVFIPPSVPHNISNSGDKPVKMLLTASPSGLEDYFVELSALLAHGGLPNVDAIAELRARFDTEQLSALKRRLRV
jgi:quercetin dioxygenase-like cupin family protein